ncbi:MAG: D-alanine--D-alanine ligase [Proteobacteria bacterium]|nr:D-alanine--D-alanine ligase [Pseudomonadota bacterium]MBU4295719.1 D-alanine--D-alanine ligase [Pseudomonadota bacterium]MCG2747220.1 D-alanine--D-alanine ligase [Desulfobulbaceae bacterium]
MTNKLRVALLAGGKSGEREVSLTGARGVLAALDKEKYVVRQYDPAIDLARLAADAAGLDVAFILLHGPLGEDGSMQGFLDLLGLPYQGSGVLGSALAMNKNLAKILYKHAGLRVADWQMASRRDIDSPENLSAQLCFPLVVKPVGQGSSLGMSIAHDNAGLAAGLKQAFDYGSEVMVEEFIRGREITGGVLGNNDLQALPLVEIIPGKDYLFFDYEAKYKAGASREICPADFPEEITRKAQDNALCAHRALRLRGYSRTDMIVSEEGEVFVIETNTIPGMTPTSLLPQAAQAVGYSFPQLLDLLIGLALEQK